MKPFKTGKESFARGAHLELCFLQRKEFAQKGAFFFFFFAPKESMCPPIPKEKGGNNKNGRVTSLGYVSVHIKYE